MGARGGGQIPTKFRKLAPLCAEEVKAAAVTNGESTFTCGAIRQESNGSYGSACCVVAFHLVLTVWLLI